MKLELPCVNQIWKNGAQDIFKFTDVGKYMSRDFGGYIPNVILTNIWFRRLLIFGYKKV